MVLYCRWFFRSGSIRGFMLNSATWTIAQISTCRHFSDRILNIKLCISLRMKMEALWLADAMRWWRQPGRAGYNFRKGGAEGCPPLSEPCGAASKEWLPRTSIWEGLLHTAKLGHEPALLLDLKFMYQSPRELEWEDWEVLQRVPRSSEPWRHDNMKRQKPTYHKKKINILSINLGDHWEFSSLASIRITWGA